jgi:hypothetical protein
VDHARRRGFAKRGGGAVMVTLDEIAVKGVCHDAELLDLDKALTQLAEVDERKSQVVELRYFVELSVEEAAEVLGISWLLVSVALMLGIYWTAASKEEAGFLTSSLAAEHAEYRKRTGMFFPLPRG